MATNARPPGTSLSSFDAAAALIASLRYPPAFWEAFQRVKFDTDDGDADRQGERIVVIVAKGEHADRIAEAYDRGDRYRAAVAAIASRRESWYEAMGDDKAGLPSEEAEAAWEIAVEALEASS
jgi:hypothetical protein